MDDEYECDYCTAAFHDITGLEEHIVDHLTISEEDLGVFQDLIRHRKIKETEGKGKTAISHEVNSSRNPHRSVKSLENENIVVSQRDSSLVEGSEYKIQRRRSIPCCICGHAVTRHPHIHTKMASKQVLMEYQCTGCRIYFETVESLENHGKDGTCNDFNKLLQEDEDFRALASKDGESANQNSKDGKLNKCLYKCSNCEHLCRDFNDWLAHEETHINLQPFRCVLCPTTLRFFRSYLEHIEKHRFSDANTQNQLHSLVECYKCQKSFGNGWDLLMHDKSTHMDLYPFRCFACSRKYHSLESFRHHKKICYVNLHKEKLIQNLGHGEFVKRETIFNQAALKFHAIFHEAQKIGKEILCPICKGKEGSFPGLTHHFAGHFGFLQCVFCNTPFKKSIMLESHLPGNSKQYACQECQQGSKHVEIIPDLVRKRKRKTYNSDKSRLNNQQYKKIAMLCDICGVTVKTRKQLKIHKKSHDKSSCIDKDVHCPKCSALCKSQAQLNMHLKRHHKTPDMLRCKICQKKLSSRATLHSHMIRSHSQKEAKFECFECKKKFVLKSELIKHSNIHMSESKPYECDQCEAAFAQNCNLTKHKIIHTGKRPYKCDKCDAAFAHRSNLNKHSLLHTGKYPFRCTVCNRGFGATKELILHKKCHSGLAKYYK